MNPVLRPLIAVCQAVIDPAARPASGRSLARTGQSLLILLFACLGGQTATGPNAMAICKPPSTRQIPSRATLRNKDDFYYQPAGLCEDYPDEARTAKRLIQDFSLLHRAGATLLRVGISWLDIESQPHRYDWRFWDLLVEMASRSHITLLPYVCYTPEWAAASPNEFWHQPPKHASDFGKFMTTIARRYRGKIHSWELWNEPDNAQFWRGSLDQYISLVVAGANGVHRADATDRIVLGGLAFGPGVFLKGLRQHPEIWKLVDVVNIHGYLETWNEDRAERYSDQIEDAARAIDSDGHSPDLWLAEFGYSDYRFTERTASDHGVTVIYDYEHTPRYQAEMLFKAHLLALATGRLSLTAWYRLHDLPPSQGVIGDDNNKHLGILDLKGQPKPAYEAFRYYHRLFSQPTRLIDRRVDLKLPAHSQSVVHVFERRDGSLIVGAWLRSSRSEEVADLSGRAKDTRREEISIALPSGSGQRTGFYDVTGHSIPSDAHLAAGTLSHIVLTGEHVFLALISP